MSIVTQRPILRLAPKAEALFSLEYFLGESDKFLAQDQLRESIGILEKGLKEYPNNPDILRKLGVNHSTLGLHAKDKANLLLSRDILNQAVSIHPNNASLLTALAVTCRRLGNTEASAEHFGKAYTIHPFHSYLTMEYSVFCASTNRRAKARKMLIRAFNNATDRQTIRRALAMCYWHFGDLPKSELIFNQLKNENLNSFAVTVGSALTYMMQRNRDAAAPEVRKANLMRPCSTLARKIRGIYVLGEKYPALAPVYAEKLALSL